MEREIEFRAKGLDNLWYYGTKKGSKANPCIMKLSQFWKQIEKGFLDIKTLGQFTGYFDEKNKRKVFEGDLYEIKGQPFEVRLSNYRFQFINPNNGSNWHLEYMGFTETKFLGTRFDNPELV